MSKERFHETYSAKGPVANHFPLTSKECMKPSAEFFLCFSKASQDNDLGTRSLHGCMTEMKEYDACMEHHYKLNPHLLIRRPPPPPLEKKVSPLEQLNNNGKKGM